MARDHRRLAAIISADVVGYSLLMGRDDSATLAGLKAHRQEIIDPKIAEYGGRIVKTTGDGLLLEFPSVVDAVRCAVDVQRGMAERNSGVPPEQRIEFRIGINVGDIIIDGEDIFGDGVNVAARLQTLAEPGGICVSRVVRDQVLDKLSFTFEDLGSQEVKNITRPVEVYRVDLGTEALQTPSRGRRRWQRLTRSPRRWVPAGVLALGLAGVAVWTIPNLLNKAPLPPAAPAMSIAILPFTAPADSPVAQQLADTISQDLTSRFARTTRSALVSAPGVAATYRGRTIDARTVGRELNVRYLVEGKVRGVGERLVVSTQLIDAGNAIQTWSEQQDVTTTRMREEQDDIVARITEGLRFALYEAEKRRAAQLSPQSANAMELVLRAYGVSDRDVSLKGALEMRKLCDEALRLDPNLGPALRCRAWTIDMEMDSSPNADFDRLAKELDEITSRAVVADPFDPRAWDWRRNALARQWRWEGAFDASAQALRLAPNSPDALVGRAYLMIFTGRPADALPLLEKATALSPGNDRLIMQFQCRANLSLGRYDDAIAACERSTALQDYWIPHLYLVAAYTQKGDAAKAAAEKAELLKQQPDMSIARLKAIRISNNPDWAEQTETYLFAPLRKVGIPER